MVGVHAKEDDSNAPAVDKVVVSRIEGRLAYYFWCKIGRGATHRLVGGIRGERRRSKAYLKHCLVADNLCQAKIRDLDNRWVIPSQQDVLGF